MKITIESTTKIVQFNGIDVRIWEGTTDSGIPVHCYIPRIAVDKEFDQTQFERELQEHAAPSLAIQAIPLRMVL